MQNVFFNDEVLIAEKNIYSSLKIPPILMMENAGANSAVHILENFKELLHTGVIIICGKGNNAGDGFVIARHLVIEGVRVKILMLYAERELKGDSLINYGILKSMRNKNPGIFYCRDDKSVKKEIVSGDKIIVDAIFGVGFRSPMEKRIEGIIKFINELKDKIVISVDVPSGLYNYNQNSVSIKACRTLTMSVKKYQTLFYKGKENSGKISVMNTGVGTEEFTKYNLGKNNIFQTEENDVRAFLPGREINSNKYNNGKVFILSGSKGLTGAACLCSMSALRTGSGAVITGVPESVNEIMEIKLTEVMTLALKETADSTLSLGSYSLIKEKLKWADAVLIGPGLSKNEETLELVRKIVNENDLHFVIDADAISAFKGNLNLLKKRKIILTPHFGEFSNLTGKSADEIKNNFYELAKAFAREYNIILVLKNSPTIITNGKIFYINSTGRENLATAGTGDVLSGIISGLYARTSDDLGCAVAGVYIHGKCGDNLYDLSGPDSTVASDLIDEIPIVKNQITEWRN